MSHGTRYKRSGVSESDIHSTRNRHDCVAAAQHVCVFTPSWGNSLATAGQQWRAAARKVPPPSAGAQVCNTGKCNTRRLLRSAEVLDENKGSTGACKVGAGGRLLLFSSFLATILRHAFLRFPPPLGQLASVAVWLCVPGSHA